MLTAEQKRNWDVIKLNQCEYCKHKRHCPLCKAMTAEYAGWSKYNITGALRMLDGDTCRQYEGKKGDVKKWS